MVERTCLMISAPHRYLCLDSIPESVSIVCLMFSFLEGLALCERGVKVRCEARDCFHLIVHLVNCFPLFNMSPAGYYWRLGYFIFKPKFTTDIDTL